MVGSVKTVQDVKLILGLIISVMCAASLIFIVAFRFLKWQHPRFLDDNYNEITLLTVVSLMMGLVLIFF